MYIGPNNKAMVTLYNYSCPEKKRKEAKPHGANPPSRKEKAHNLKYLSSVCLYLHFDELNELLPVKDFDEEIMNSMIKR